MATLVAFVSSWLAPAHLAVDLIRKYDRRAVPPPRQHAVVASYLPLSGENGRHELRIGMPAAAKIADDRRPVKRHVPVRPHQLIAAVLEEQPAGEAAIPGQACAARIEGADAADDAVGSGVSVTPHDNVGIGARELAGH